MECKVRFLMQFSNQQVEIVEILSEIWSLLTGDPIIIKKISTS